MSRQTDDGLHEGYIAVELSTAWAGGYTRFDESTGTWWTSTWAQNRPPVTGRFRVQCDHAHPSNWGSRTEWFGPIVTLGHDDGDLAADVEEALMSAWNVHIEAAAS